MTASHLPGFHSKNHHLEQQQKMLCNKLNRSVIEYKLNHALYNWMKGDERTVTVQNRNTLAGWTPDHIYPTSSDSGVTLSCKKLLLILQFLMAEIMSIYKRKNIPMVFIVNLELWGGGGGNCLTFISASQPLKLACTFSMYNSKYLPHF